MSGTVTLLVLLSCYQVYAKDDIEPPQELNVVVSSPGKVFMTWKHIVPPQNKSIKYHVKVITPEKVEDFKIFNNHSSRMVALHRGLTVQVAAVYVLKYNGSSKNSEVSKWVSKDVPPYPGDEGTSVMDLSCQIEIEASEQCYLSCKWAPGDKAPADTEYNLYYRYGDVTERCQDYETEPRAQRRTGCRILSRVISILTNKKFLVHINGTSKTLQIKAIEKIFLSSEIEIIPPVQNLTIDVNGLRWIKPLRSIPESCFLYEINIWSRGWNDTIKVMHLTYVRNVSQKASTKQFIRVRAVGKLPCWHYNTHSVWTDIIHIGEDDRSDTLEITVSLCLVVTCIVIFLLCIRFWGLIFPQIPKPKNDLKEAFQNVQSQALIRCNSLDSEEVISYIEEMVQSDKYKMSSDYGHIGNYYSAGVC